MTNHIQINDIAPCIHYECDGTQAAFAFPFAVFRAADLEVWLDGARVNAGFSVSGVGVSAGGAVLFVTPPAAGAGLTLRRRVVLERVSDFQTDGIIRAKTLNDELDYQVAAVQQVADDVSRCVHRPFTSRSTADLAVPDPVGGRALKWNADGSGLANSDHDPDAVARLAQTQAQAAEASAAQAAADAAAAQAAMTAANTAMTVAQTAAEQAQEAAASVGEPLGRSANLGDLPDPAAARANLGLAAVAASGAYADLSGLPELGSAAAAMLGTAPGQVPTADQVPGLVQGVPTGCILPFAGTVAPMGWLLCDGAAISRSAYAELFAVIGILHGAGDGVDTFNLPDLRGRAPIGAGQGDGLSNRVLAAKLGAETHTLTVGEMPSHSHSIPAGPPGGAGYAFTTQGITNSTYTGGAGGGGAHNNMQPSLVLNFIIKT